MSTRQKLFDDFGVEIFEDTDGRHVIRWDNGGGVIHMTEADITAEEARRAQLSEEDAYQVILACERRGKASSAS